MKNKIVNIVAPLLLAIQFFVIVSLITGVLLSAEPAQAIIVNVKGTNYDVTTFEGAYMNDHKKFNTTLMPWWKNSQLAEDFTLSVKEQLGSPNLLGGPYFATDASAQGEVLIYTYNDYDHSLVVTDLGKDQTRTFAEVETIPAP